MTAPELEPAGSLVEALARVQAVIPHVLKGRTADTGTYSYRYADLADVTAAILPLLGANGLAFVTRPTVIADGSFALEYALKHAGSGEQEAGTYPLPDPRRTKAQELGSAITYARRYVLTCVTGVVPDEDDDGRGAMQRAAAADPAPPPRPAPGALAADAAARLEVFTGPVAILDNVLAHAADNGYARELVTVLVDGAPTRAPFARAVELKREQLEAAAVEAERAAVTAAQEPATDAPAPEVDPAPAPPQEAAQQPPAAAEDAEQNIAEAMTYDALREASADALVAAFREARDAGLIDRVIALSFTDRTALEVPAGPVKLGALLMHLGKRLRAGAGPLVVDGPPDTVPADGWPEQGPAPDPDTLL